MKIEWLETFTTAALYENFRQAAEVLFITQPAVTIHIHNLEKQLGFKLFVSKGRRVTLSPDGRRFLPHAQAILKSYHFGLEDMEQWQQGKTRTLTIAVSPLLAVSMLPRVIRRFIKTYPHIDVVINVQESALIERRLHDGSADLGLSLLPASGSDMHQKLLHQEPVLLIAPHDGGDAETALPLDSTEVLTKNVVFTYNHPGYWETLLRKLRTRFPALQTMEVSQSHVTKRFIEEGLGVSFLPRSAVRRELAEGRVLHVDAPEFDLPQASTYLLYKYTNEEVFQFLDYV
ncbi:LysR family transcriptional regulator [Marinococcus luteus]|uniref:LysR family transcriptional regulator n=1 Tax=Marinococcus luteus TaxID=1122204 RepID=UPI002ACD080E|nr:LysR family transcriptional regulator [Marinococcus luteus]MDZ5783365.1 LysR family transcriptional regulator [Marinococcus luteus]